MKTWTMALLGLATLSTSAFAVPVTTGSATAAKVTAGLVAIPDLGEDEIVVVTDKATGEISVKGADGSLFATQETSAAEAQKVCYGGPCGLVYGPGNGYVGYGAPVAPPVAVVEGERYKEEHYRRSYVVPGYGYGPGAIVNEHVDVYKEQRYRRVVPVAPPVAVPYGY